LMGYMYQLYQYMYVRILANPLIRGNMFWRTSAHDALWTAPPSTVELTIMRSVERRFRKV
jgi:hypothetical protein